MMFETFAKSISQALVPALSALQSSGGPSANTAPRVGRPRGDCHYCGEAGHAIAACPRVAEDIKAGRCARGFDGRVILPTGSYVPSSMAGNTMRERINEWHRQNPGHISPTNPPAAQMLYEISDHPPASCFTLSTDDRIAALKLELERLRGGNGAGSRSREVFDGVELPARNRYKAKVAPPTIPGSESRNASQTPAASLVSKLEDSTPA